MRWFISLTALGVRVILPFLDVSRAYMDQSEELKSTVTL
jgi:hypothetical protein